MQPAEILEHTRKLIAEHADGDPDRWWYANRFVFARLMVDERKTKTAVKRKLMDAGASCHACGAAFETTKGIHLHRVDGSRGHSDENCVLMHGACHQEHHAAQPHEREDAAGAEPVVRKRSKRYDDKPFTYWWDISPWLAERLDAVECFEFLKVDTGEYCSVPTDELRGFLTVDRRTSRGGGNWGVRVLQERPDELAFEPPTGSDEWLFLSMEWLTDADGD